MHESISALNPVIAWPDVAVPELLNFSADDIRNFSTHCMDLINPNDVKCHDAMNNLSEWEDGSVVGLLKESKMLLDCVDRVVPVGSIPWFDRSFTSGHRAVIETFVTNNFQWADIKPPHDRRDQKLHFSAMETRIRVEMAALIKSREMATQIKKREVAPLKKLSDKHTKAAGIH